MSSESRTISTCEFGKKGGARCDLMWPARKGKPEGARWEKAIQQDLCTTCGNEVRRRHAAKVFRQ